MKCKVEVTSPDGSSTIARALIDPGSSASFVHEQIVPHICLPRSNKNARVEGVAGTITATRGSVWFKVSGVEDKADKIIVEAFSAKEDHKGSISASDPMHLPSIGTVCQT